MKLWDVLFDYAGRLSFNIVYQAVKRDEKNQIKNQKRIFKSLVSILKNTEFGDKYNLSKFYKSDNIYQNFSKNIPIVEYKDFKNYIEKSKIEKNVIWPGKITKFSASSGTTGDKKHIPVTRQSMMSTTKAGAYMFAEILHGYKGIHFLRGDVLPLTGTIQESNNGINVGDVSALILLSRRGATSSRYSLPKSILLNPNWEDKIKIIYNQINENRENTMIGVTSWAYEILKYIENKDKEKFENLVKNMELIIGGGVDVSPYMYYFKKHNIKYMGVYNASEGYFAYQDIVNYDNSNGIAPYKFLTNHGVFYEFLEFNCDNFDDEGNIKKTAKAKSFWEIDEKDIGKNFALVITTNGGLVRYLIGDVIRFTDKNLRFQIVGRTRQSINLKGEELMETHINSVIEKIAKNDGMNIIYYTVGPDLETGPNAHEWIVELDNEGNISENDLAIKIDSLLQKINPDYKAKRKNDILLKLPKIHIAKKGTFYNWMKKNNRLGSQVKVPKLSNKRKILEEILQIQ